MEKPSGPGINSKQQNKPKKKQIKVVYISNPLRVKTTAEEFKGLVQELTGQDSDIAERLPKSNGKMELDDGGSASVDQGSFSSDGSLASSVAQPPDARNGELIQYPQQQQQQQQLTPNAGERTAPYDVFDEDFPPEMLDDLDSFMPTSSYYGYPSPAIDDSKDVGGE